MATSPFGEFGSLRDRTGFFVRRTHPLATLFAFLLSFVALVIILVPIALIGILILLWIVIRSVLAAVLGVFRKTTNPNGVLDGRRNVRVRMPTDSTGV